MELNFGKSENIFPEGMSEEKKNSLEKTMKMVVFMADTHQDSMVELAKLCETKEELAAACYAYGGLVVRLGEIIKSV